MRANMGEGDVLLEDLEGLLREINEFCSAIHNKPEDIPQSLERYLNYVARSGNTVFPWQHVRPLFRSKILQSMDQFPGEICPNNESFVLERFDLFRAAPFTIQRLTELITQPTRHYKKKEKYIRGLEKTVLVVSTVEPWSVDNDIRNGNDSASDGEMDQTYSESDDSSANRTFTMDTVGTHGESDRMSLLNNSPDTRLQNVTTTMINITSNGNQSTTTIGSTSSSSSGGDGITSRVMSSSELGLSSVITSDNNSEDLIQPNSGNFLPVNIMEQVSEQVTTIIGHGCNPSAVVVQAEEIVAVFEPIAAADEDQNQQISSNLIVVNIEQGNETSTLAASEIVEGIPMAPVEVAAMDLGEVPIIITGTATVDDSQNLGDSNPRLIVQEGQLTSSNELSVQERVDKEVKIDLEEDAVLESIIPIIVPVQDPINPIGDQDPISDTIPGFEPNSATVIVAEQQQLSSDRLTESDPVPEETSEIPVADSDDNAAESSPPNPIQGVLDTNSS